MRKIKILALGSSITNGYGNKGVSFVDMLNNFHDENLSFEVDKEAIDGTSLANKKKNSYLARLRIISDAKLKLYNYVIVQLSTNDLHLLFNNYDLTDEKTTFGAVYKICEYIKSKSEAKIIFYTCFIKKNPKYEMMISVLEQIKTKLGFDIIDFYNDEDLRNDIFNSLMSDDIHPNEKGYEIMTDKFVKYFKNN